MVDRSTAPQRSRERDKALVIALNYGAEPDDSSVRPLKTPIRDAEDLARLLEEKGYFRRNITIMTDELPDLSMRPTRTHIVRRSPTYFLIAFSPPSSSESWTTLLEMYKRGIGVFFLVSSMQCPRRQKPNFASPSWWSWLSNREPHRRRAG